MCFLFVFGLGMKHPIPKLRFTLIHYQNLDQGKSPRYDEKDLFKRCFMELEISTGF